MRKIVLVMLCGLVFMTGFVISAEEGIIDRVEAACKPEIEKYCSQVTPGEGRMIACFYAFGDKLSPRCEYAVVQGIAELEQFVTAMSHLATECHDDLLKFCGEVEIGEGRVGACLLEHKAEVTEACAQAVDDTGLEVFED